jgi:putative ABC transport system permease protein
MSVWWRIAWRNLWRNRKRTVITAAALAFGFLAAVLMVALSDGIVAEMVENGTGLVTGQIEVQARGYRPERNLYSTIGGDAGTNVSALLDTVAATPGVVAVAPRVYAGGLISAGDHTAGVMLMGVDPRRERGVSRLLSYMRQGRAPAPGAREVAIGQQLAEKLGVRVGAEVVLVAPAADGSLGNDLYRVSGIFSAGVPDLDGSYAVLPLGVLQTLLVLDPGRIHEVGVALADAWQAPAVATALGPRLDRLGLDVVADPWTQFRPELAQYAQMAKASNGIIVAIVFVMAIFGVANTMLMGTFERRREFAVVRALGTGPGDVARTVVFEGVTLGLISLAAGAVLTAPILLWWHHSPPDLSHIVGGFTMAGALVRPVLRVEYSVQAPVLSAVALLLTTLIAALYPAWRAARVPPADALAGR